MCTPFEFVHELFAFLYQSPLFAFELPTLELTGWVGRYTYILIRFGRGLNPALRG